ncbi:MAG TPA: glycosyl transferase [Ornithinibacter sp.]|nr:glycosyl transferase [Ornithinibacter sp.]
MTWSVGLALLGTAVVGVIAWLLGRPRPATLLDADLEADDRWPAHAGEGFAAQVRGYRMDQVDAVVDALEARVAAHDRAIARRRGEARPDAPDAVAAGPRTSTGAAGGPRASAPGDGPASRRGAAPGRAGSAAARPLPLRRSDLLAPAAYLLVSAWLHVGLLAAPRTGHLSQGVQDQQAFEWYFGATAHNLATFSNPLFSDLQNFPDGVNLMANASVLGLGVPLAPLTLLAGPQATFIVVQLLGLALTASAWFWLFRRRLAVHPVAAALGAGFAGFAPGLVAHANGHPNFVAQFLVPVIVDRVLRLADGDRPRRDGVVLGLLVAWQVFIGEEVLLLTVVGIVIAGLVLLAHGRVDLRRLLPGLGIGAATCLAIVAVPLWWQFAGPRSYASIYHPFGGNDLAQLWGRATRSLGADPWAAAAVSMNRTEENSFFGVPLLLAALAVTVVLWRRVLVRALAAVVVVSCWLSLGNEVTLHGAATGIPGPWALLELVPVVENVLPTRFALVAVPALGALLALGTEEVRVRAGRHAGHAGAGLAVAAVAAGLVLLPVVPTPLVVEPRAPMPAFFSDGTWRDWVDEGGSVLAAPAPWVGDTRALEWQARARWGFPVVAGYFVGPDSSPERVGQYGATPTALTQWMAGIAEDGVARPPSEGELEQFRADLRTGRVDAVVLPDTRPEAPALLASLSAAFGAPEHLGGVHVWDVRSVADGAG